MTGDETRPASTFEWVRFVSRVSFGTSDSAKGVAGRTIKGVAFRLSYWANSDGSKVLAGPARIAVTCEVDYKTAKNVLATLRRAGLLTLTSRGRGPSAEGRTAVGDEYHLSIPVEPREGLRVRSDAEVDAEIAAVKEANSRKPTGVQRPRKNTELRGDGAPVSANAADRVTGELVPRESELRGNPGVSYGVTGSAIPTQHQPLKDNRPSLSGASSSASAPGDLSPDERERDDESSEDLDNVNNPDGFRERLVIKNGAPRHLATQIADFIEATNIIDGIGWWVTADKNGTLAVQVRDALPNFPGYGPDATAAAGPHCTTCSDSGQVEIRNPYEGDSVKLVDCTACTNDGRGGCRYHRGQKARRCGACRADRIATGNEQPRTSQRVNPNSIRNSHDNVDRYDVPIGAYLGAGPPSAEVRKYNEYGAAGMALDQLPEDQQIAVLYGRQDASQPEITTHETREEW